MYNLIIALSIAAASFALGMTIAGTLVAGFVPASIGMLIAYFLLARRTGNQFRVIAERAAAEFQAGRMGPGLKLMESCLKLSKWQFGISGQVHGQIGMLMYMQRKWSEARTNLSQAWKRDWRARSMLAALEHRQGNKEKALELMSELISHGGKDPVFWALYAYLAVESKKRDLALEMLSEGLKKCKDSPGLLDLQKSVANKKKLKMKAFAPTWYQYFPEQMPRAQMQATAQQHRGMSIPQPRR
jgi:uncharacterized protein HemY